MLSCSKKTATVHPAAPEAVNFGGFIPKPPPIELSGRKDLWLPEHTGEEVVDDRRRTHGSWMATGISKHLAPFIVKFRKIVVLSFVVFVGICFWQCTFVKPASEPPQIVAEGSNLAKVQQLADLFKDWDPYSGGLMTVGAGYAAPRPPPGPATPSPPATTTPTTTSTSTTTIVVPTLSVIVPMDVDVSSLTNADLEVLKSGVIDMTVSAAAGGFTSAEVTYIGLEQDAVEYRRHRRANMPIIATLYFAVGSVDPAVAAVAINSAIATGNFIVTVTFSDGTTLLNGQFTDG